MAHTFDIRFARSAGFAALLEAPTNSFRWKGNGRLVIDTHGVSVAVTRGLLSILSRNRVRRIPSAKLSQVFREGDALRVEFATDESARASLMFWARDRDAAAQIVKLMPTSRTVELETNGVARDFKLNWRAVLWLGVALTAMTSGFLLLRATGVTGQLAETGVPDPAVSAGRGSRADDFIGFPDTAGRLSDTAATNLPAAASAPSRPVRTREIVIPVYADRPATRLTTSKTVKSASPVIDASDPVTIATLERLAMTQQAARPLVFHVRVSSDGVLPLVAGMAGYEAARREIAVFSVESEGRTWWEMTARIHNSAVFDDPALWPLRDAELAASRAWRTYYEFYRGSGLNDEAAQLEFARMLTARVYQYVD
jgi:hypothetical protein